MPFLRKLYKLVLLLILTFVVSIITSAQLHPSYFIKTKKDGLQSNQIYSIHAAKNGLLYIAHSKGLSSFDGNAFTNYFNRALPFTEMSNIMETENGDIFCKAFNNNLFKVEGDSIIKIRYFPNKFGFSPSAAYKNTIISTSNDSIYFYNAVNHTFDAQIKKPKKLHNNGEPIIFSCYPIDQNPTFLLGINDHFEQIKIFQPDQHVGHFHLSNSHLFGVIDKSMNELFHYNNNESIHIERHDANQLFNYISVTNQHIWICTTNGLYYFDIHKGPNSIHYILPGYNVSAVVQTRENSFVASTLGDGLIFIPSFEINKLPNISFQIVNLNGYLNQLLLGSKNGNIYTYDLPSLTIKNKIQDSGNKQKSIMLFDTIHNAFFSSSSITTYKDGNRNVNLPFTIKDFSYFNRNIILSSNDGMYIYGDINSFGWLSKFIDKKKSSIPNLYRLNLFDDYVASAKYDSIHHKILINTYSGIFEMVEGYSHPIKLGDPNIVLSDMCIWNGDLLFATKDKGILKWKGNNYLPAFTNSPSGIFLKFEVYKDELWIQAESALYRYKNGEFTKYDARYGDLFDRFIDFHITDSFVYVNTVDDIVEFPKSISLANNVTPKFLLNSIYSSHQKKNINENSVLTFDDNSLSIKFSLISFALANNTHLAYKINEQEAIHLQNSNRQINLNNLSPDKYSIQFFIVTDNIINAQPSYIFSFTIKPPFYKTWWFMVLIMAFIAAIISLLFKRTLDRWKKETLLKESKLLLEKELDKSMMSSIKAQMNPHFLFNALNTIQSFIYANDKQNAGIYISKFSDLTRSILDMSTKETISLDEEIKSLKLYLELEKMRFEDSFDYKIYIDPSLNKEMVKIPSMLVQPYVENAIKHGLLHKKTNRELKIQFSQDELLLIISIDDNGIGRKKSEELNKLKFQSHTSFAMNANKKRLEILKNNFENISFEIIDKYGSLGEPIGTKVIIKLPF